MTLRWRWRRKPAGTAQPGAHAGAPAGVPAAAQPGAAGMMVEVSSSAARAAALPASTASHGPAAGKRQRATLAGVLAQSPLATRCRTLQRQFDQRNQRERLLLTCVALALALMLGDALWLGPALAGFRTAQSQLKAAQRDLASLQAEARTQQDIGSQQAHQQQAELTMWRQRVRQGETQLRGHEETLVGPDRMVGLLEQLLARHGAVRVRALRSLGRTDLLAGNAAPEPAKTGTPAPAVAAAGAASQPTGQPGAAPGQAGSPSLYRHGVELVLEGSYANLLQYLREVEGLPQRVLWGGVSLKVEQHPTCVLTLRVYTISRDRHWLEI